MGNIWFSYEHWDIYLQFCMWDDYHVFLIATLLFTRLLLDEIYHLSNYHLSDCLWCNVFVCLLDELILGYCYSDLTWETGGFELPSTITLVLQANRPTKCASHPSVIISANHSFMLCFPSIFLFTLFTVFLWIL